MTQEVVPRNLPVRGLQEVNSVRNHGPRDDSFLLDGNARAITVAVQVRIGIRIVGPKIMGYRGDGESRTPYSSVQAGAADVVDRYYPSGCSPRSCHRSKFRSLYADDGSTDRVQNADFHVCIPPVSAENRSPAVEICYVHGRPDLLYTDDGAPRIVGKSVVEKILGRRKCVITDRCAAVFQVKVRDVD